MKKLYSILAVVAMTTVANAQDSMNAFKGSDFENFEDFKSGLSAFGLKSYATQGVGEGVDGSSSLSITGTPTGNDYVFTAIAPEGIPQSKIESISFMVKGTAGKSLSINIYKDSTGFYPFNVGELTADKEISTSGNNQYTGTIDTQGNWVKVTLKLSDIADYSKVSTSNFFALKVGKDVSYDIDIDNITINYDKTLSAATFTKEKASLVRNTEVTSDIEFLAKSDVKIYNLNGQLVKEVSVNAGTKLNLSSLAKGVYVVTGVVEGQKVSQKIIKK